MSYEVRYNTQLIFHLFFYLALFYMTLSNKQQRFLRSKAHELKPVVIIGNAGLTDGVLNEIDSVLETHELIKIRVNAENKEDRQQMLTTISSITTAALVQLIGHIAIFYRARKKDPSIKIPKN